MYIYTLRCCHFGLEWFSCCCGQGSKTEQADGLEGNVQDQLKVSCVFSFNRLVLFLEMLSTSFTGFFNCFYVTALKKTETNWPICCHEVVSANRCTEAVSLVSASKLNLRYCFLPLKSFMTRNPQVHLSLYEPVHQLRMFICSASSQYSTVNGKDKEACFRPLSV